MQAGVHADEPAALRRDRALGRLVRRRGCAGEPGIIRGRIDHEPRRRELRRHQHGEKRVVENQDSRFRPAAIRADDTKRGSPSAGSDAVPMASARTAAL